MHLYTLELTIKKAKHIKSANLLGGTDGYIVYTLSTNGNCNKIGQTPVEKGTTSPKWKFKEKFGKICGNSKIEFDLYDWNKITSHKLIGKCELPISKLTVGTREVIELEFDTKGSLYLECYLEIWQPPLPLPSDMLYEIFSFLENDEQASLNFQLTSRNYYRAARSYRYTEIEIPTLGKYTFYQGAPNHFYLSLPNPRNNYSNYKVPTRKPLGIYDSDIITRWFKLRIDPKTLLINTSDYRFAKSTGKCHHHTWNTDRVPYATCFGCEAGSRDDGRAKCDITGTPFTFKVEFIHNGHCSYGTWNFSKNHQIIDISGGGYCGWTCPSKAENENQAVDGGWYVQLNVLHE